MSSLGAASPGLWAWSLDVPSVIVLGFALLYAIGSARTVTPARLRAQQRWRSACFYAAIAVLAIALASPLDALSQQLFWAHMTQHVLLMLVAPPLIVAARPWPRLWRALPLGSRRRLGRALVKGPRAAPLRAAARTIGRPSVSLVLFCGVLLAWHVPALFDATLRSNALHALEHSLFFCTALLFWKQVITSPPLRAPLGATAADPLRDRRDGRQLGARGRAGARAEPAVRALRPRAQPAGRALGARRPADRGRGDVGARVGDVPAGDVHLRPPLARTGPAGASALLAPGTRVLGGSMPGTAPLLATFLAGSILSLVLPIAVVVIVTIWYVGVWRRGSGER